MALITIHFSERDKKILESYLKTEGCSISEIIQDIIDEETDVKLNPKEAREYEFKDEHGSLGLFTRSELEKVLIVMLRDTSKDK